MGVATRPVAAPGLSRRAVDRRTVAGMAEKVQGPASYFPSIEKKYGQPIDYWLTELDKVADQPHMKQVEYLKTEHGLGHGHANALVAYKLKS